MDRGRYPEAWDGTKPNLIPFQEMFINPPTLEFDTLGFLGKLEEEPSAFQRSIVGLALALGDGSWSDQGGWFLDGFVSAFSLIFQLPALSLANNTPNDVHQSRMAEQVIADISADETRSISLADFKPTTVHGVGSRFYDNFWPSFRDFFTNNILAQGGRTKSEQAIMKVGAGWAPKVILLRYYGCSRECHT